MGDRNRFVYLWLPLVVQNYQPIRKLLQGPRPPTPGPRGLFVLSLTRSSNFLVASLAASTDVALPRQIPSLTLRTTPPMLCESFLMAFPCLPKSAGTIQCSTAAVTSRADHSDRAARTASTCHVRWRGVVLEFGVWVWLAAVFCGSGGVAGRRRGYFKPFKYLGDLCGTGGTRARHQTAVSGFDL